MTGMQQIKVAVTGKEPSLALELDAGKAKLKEVSKEKIMTATVCGHELK